MVTAWHCRSWLCWRQAFFSFFFLIYRYVLSIFKMMSSQEKKKERNCFIWHIKLEWNNILCVHWWNRHSSRHHSFASLCQYIYTVIYMHFPHFEIFMQKKRTIGIDVFFPFFFLIKINISIINAIPYSWFSLIIENYRKFFSEKTPQC